MKQKIKDTAEYKRLVKQSPFLDKVLLKKENVNSIERIIYQIQKLGESYIEDKNYSEREVKMAKQVIENEKI